MYFLHVHAWYKLAASSFQVVESYSAAMKICKIEHTKKKLEAELFEM